MGRRKKERRKKFEVPEVTLKQKEVVCNSIDFPRPKPHEEVILQKPAIPRLPFLPPSKKLSKRRSQTLIESNFSPKVTSARAKVQSDLNFYSVSLPEREKSPEFYPLGQTTLKVSSLNKNYHTNEESIMKYIEKAKKYFPIPLGRKHLKTSSMSISHTPMSRLYSPQNFTLRKSFQKA